MAAAATAAGLVVGGVVAGVGGRLAMRLLAVTSDDSLGGRVTDDDEVVGQITLGGSVGFVIFMALGGAALALVYLLLRRWLPADPRWRAGAYGLLFWAIQGRDLFDADGFDFDELSPRWLSVSSFSAILLATGALVASTVDRAVQRRPSRTSWPSLLPLVPLLAIGPVAVPIAVAGLAAYGLHRVPAARAVWESRPVTVMGAAVLAAVGLSAGIPAIAEVAEILS